MLIKKKPAIYLICDGWHLGKSGEGFFSRESENAKTINAEEGNLKLSLWRKVIMMQEYSSSFLLVSIGHMMRYLLAIVPGFHSRCQGIEAGELYFCPV